MKLHAHGESGRGIDNDESPLESQQVTAECRDARCGRAGRLDGSEISVTDSRRARD